ncbi:hypothetical protein ELI_12390 [Erythrobacter litoralis HTCC2594]|uniref:Transmembrane protein n=1 Tax=Erythrobacter litoralis (strain HTCC2594) TaxID=314225 RepID=Q2N6X1_ERYLH|nr:hypothetical protein ELI_12390 [Erythrobacter litoralis HTCC2594]
MTEAAESVGRSPFFWGGLMFGAYGAIAGLAFTGAIEGMAVLLIMLAPMGLMIPLIRSANRRVDAGGTACLNKGEAQKRYLKRVAISTSLYMIAIALMVLVENSDGRAETLRILVAVLPGLAVIGVFWAIGRLIVEEQDEFIRMLVIRQSLIATGFALSIASVWGFLEQVEAVPHLPAYWWAVAWFFGLAIGAAANRITYGSWGAV